MLAHRQRSLAAKAATKTIPIVFTSGGDPVELGLVSSLNRPGANVTGVSFLVNELGAKRVELLRDLVPTATLIGFLANPTRPSFEAETKDTLRAAQVLGLQLYVFNARNEREIEAAFANFAQRRVNALLVGTDLLFLSRRDQLVALAARLAIPTMYSLREYVVAGGLMSYAPSIADVYRQAGIYTGENSQRCEGGRSARAAADKIRAGDQSQNGQGTRPYGAIYHANDRRRGDRIAEPFAATRQVAIGTSRQIPTRP